MQYDVTIGIPVYKSADYIKRTLYSALCQTYPSIEYLIIDDCGNDGSLEIIRKIKSDHPRGKDIHIIHHKNNLGVGVARNRILDEAKGQFLLFLDSDDFLEPNAIELFIVAIKRTDADVVYGSWIRIDVLNSNKTNITNYPYRELLTEDALALYAFKNYSSFRISVCNCLIRMSFIKNNDLHFIDSSFWEDLVFTYEMVAKVKRALLLPDITYRYMCRGNSLSHYQDRVIIPKQEILSNISAIVYLKKKCRDLDNKVFVPYLCYNLGMNSYYVISYVLYNYHKILPKLDNSEISRILFCPKSLSSIMKFKTKVLPNLFFWGLSKIPFYVALLFIRFLRIIKSN